MNQKKQILATTALVAGSFLQSGTPAFAQSSIGDSYAKLLEKGTLYQNPEATVIQKFALTGRLQADYYNFDEDTAGSIDDLAWRRFRAGFKATIFKNLTLHSEAEMDLNHSDPLYERLTDTNISWKTSGGTKIKLGKQSAPFTLDGATSSKKLHTLERSKIADNIWFSKEYFVGATASGKKDNWEYIAGLYSSDGAPEFDEAFEAGKFFLVSLGYDFKEKFGADKALLRLDFVSNEEDPGNRTGKHDTAFSVVGKYDKGAKHIWADISLTEGYAGQPDLFGLQIMPFYDLNETSQVIFRYTYMDSDNGDGIKLSKYEKSLVSGKGNQANEYYLGYNHFFHGHKLKWQTGVQYTKMDASAVANEYDGWGITSGLRLSW
jgi:phosphate-selective porin OprO/OprP